MKEVIRQKYLFLDDRHIKDMEGTRLAVNPARKADANPITGNLWGRDRKQAGNLHTVLYDHADKRFKAWYNVGWHPTYDLDMDDPANHVPSPDFDKGGAWNAFAYAVSEDGIHWEKPDLGLTEFDGSKANNILFLNRNIHGNVIKDPSECRPDRKYKMVFSADSESLIFTGTFVPLNAAYSPDGIHWTIPGHKERHWPYSFHSELPFTTNPIMPEGTDALTCYALYWDADLRKYVHLLRPSWNVPRRICMSESDDFMHWTPRQVILEPDNQDPPQISSFHGMTVMRYDEYYIGFLQVMHAADEYEYWVSHHGVTPDMPDWMAKVDVQLALSYDGRDWKRVADRSPFIPIGSEGEWDDGMIFPHNQSFVLNDEVWIYYGGCKGRHTYEGQKHTYERASGMARVRKDGFISVDADKAGTMTTRNLQMVPCEVFLNAAVEKGGSISVEVLNPLGQAMEGFSKDDCIPVTGDSLDHTVRWKHGKPVVSIVEKLYGGLCLKFYLERAKLYSLTQTWPTREGVPLSGDEAKTWQG